MIKYNEEKGGGPSQETSKIDHNNSSQRQNELAEKEMKDFPNATKDIFEDV